MRCPKRNLKKYSSRDSTPLPVKFSVKILLCSAYPSMLHTVTSILCCRTYLFMSYKPFYMPTFFVHHHSVFKQIRKTATEIITSQTSQIWFQISWFFSPSSCRITTTAACMMDLRRYPLDEQNCTLEIESCKLLEGEGWLNNISGLKGSHGLNKAGVNCSTIAHPVSLHTEHIFL